MAWTILHGPVDVLAGLIFGTIAGAICGATKVWNEPWKRSSMVFMLGMFMMFMGRSYGFNGGGAMSSLALGIGIQNFPEGLAVSMPLMREGVSPLKAFWCAQAPRELMRRRRAASSLLLGC